MTIYEFLKNKVRQIFRRTGFDLVRTKHLKTAASRRAVMLRYHRIQTVLDVGANVGDYGLELREWGYKGRILSFEPTSAAFKALSRRASADALWSVFNYALGGEEGVAEINIASNDGASSSIMPMLDSHRQSAPEVDFVGTEQITVKTLNDALVNLVTGGEALMLKIDTQGFEHLVLRGASAILPRVQLLECELSFVSLYEGQLIFPQMLRLLDSLDFQPVQFSPGFSDIVSGYCLQVDGTFARKR